MTQVVWEAGKLIVCEVTVICTSVNSYIETSSGEAGNTVECKEAQYSDKPTQ